VTPTRTVSVQIVRWALAATLVAACGAPQSAGAPASTPTQSGTTGPAAAVLASASLGSATRVDGTVQSAAASLLTLSDGSALQLTATTRIVRTDRATIADLTPGLFIAITAKQQPDSTLLASIVNIFPASLGASIPAGQRPLTDGNLMTNAPIAAIDQVSGSSFKVTFSGTTTRVVLGPGAVITKQTDVKPDEIPVGTKISATVRAGIAQSIQYQGP
jgi:hypothetical protein